MNIFYALTLISLGVCLGIGLMCLLFVARSSDDRIEKMMEEEK